MCEKVGFDANVAIHHGGVCQVVAVRLPYVDLVVWVIHLKALTHSLRQLSARTLNRHELVLK